jgi:hypothetical protein
MGDRHLLAPDCHLKAGKATCWFEVDDKTLAPKQRLEVKGLPEG